MDKTVESITVLYTLPGAQPAPAKGEALFVHPNSGNVLPWSAVAYRDGKYVGSTGFCRSEQRAEAAGRRLLAKARIR